MAGSDGSEFAGGLERGLDEPHNRVAKGEEEDRKGSLCGGAGGPSVWGEDGRRGEFYGGDGCGRWSGGRRCWNQTEVVGG